MRRILALALLGVGASIALVAAPAAPEIDPGSCAGALALVGGVLLLIRGRRKG